MSESRLKTGVRRSKTGVPGLDDVLNGGLIPHRLYLVDGDPGAGKTTLSLQFLLEGARAGEKCLYITLSETKEELTAGATSHDWSLDGSRSSNSSPTQRTSMPTRR
jgi:circadian clock protein KaiC